MTEKLSAFVEDTAKNRSVDLKQARINELLDQRQTLVDSGKLNDDPEVLAISQSLLEMTDPQIGQRSTEVESLLQSITKKAPPTTSTVDNTPVGSSRENIDEYKDSFEFIKTKLERISIVHTRLLNELFPQLEGTAKNYISGEIKKFDLEYSLFQREVREFPFKDDISLVAEAFEKAFSHWFDRIFSLFKEAHQRIDKH